MRRTAIIALWFLGVSAIAGAVPLILYPSGAPWGFLPLSLLDHSPFHSYLIPGIILLLANGVLSLLVLNLTVRRRPGYAWWIAIQGSILSGWIVIEVIMIRMISWAHYLYLAIGLVLILSGLALARKNREY